MLGVKFHHVSLGVHALVAVGGAAAVVAAIDGAAGVVGAVRADEHPTALGEARDVEGAGERVEQARVIGVLHVLDVEGPVVRQGLGEAAVAAAPGATGV